MVGKGKRKGVCRVLVWYGVAQVQGKEHGIIVPNIQSTIANAGLVPKPPRATAKAESSCKCTENRAPHMELKINLDCETCLKVRD